MAIRTKPAAFRRAIPLVLTIALLAGEPAAAQTEATADEWVQSRTADGQPDMQGTWNNTTITPFERRAQQADRAYLTEEEAADAERQANERRTQANAQRPPRTEPLPVGPTGAVNSFWFEPRLEVVATRRTSLVIDPPDGRVPLRQEAETRRDYLVEHRADAVENMSVYSRCITRGVPGTMFPNAYNNGYQILQIPGYVVIRVEMMHVRVIRLDAGPHVDPKIRGWMGDSRGHWEGDTLVVETTNFDPRGWISSNASAGRMHTVPQTAALKVVERFRRIDENTIDWQATIEDPAVYTRPWTVAITLHREHDYIIYEYACHEGNHAISGVLGGQRVVELRDAVR